MAPWLDFEKHRICFDKDDWYHLDPQDWHILAELIRHPGRPVTLKRLVFVLYGDDIDGGPLSADNVVRVKICGLRKLLPWPIIWARGVGYWIEDYCAPTSPASASRAP